MGLVDVTAAVAMRIDEARALHHSAEIGEHPAGLLAGKDPARDRFLSQVRNGDALVASSSSEVASDRQQPLNIPPVPRRTADEPDAIIRTKA